MTQIASTLGTCLLLPYLGTVHPSGTPLEVPPCIRTGMRRMEWPSIRTATTNLGGTRTTTPTTVNRPSWSIRMTRNRNGRPSPLRRHLQDRPHIPFPSGSESTRSFTRRSRRRARNMVLESMLKMPFCCWASKGMRSFTPVLSETLSRCLAAPLYRSAQEANRPRTRCWISPAFLHPPHPRPPHPLFVILILKIALDCLFLPATQHILPLLLKRTTLPCKPTPIPQPQPVRFLRLVLCPTPPSLFASSQIRTNLNSNAS